MRQKQLYLEREITKKKDRERQEFYENCTFSPKINKQSTYNYAYKARGNSASSMYEQAMENQRRKEEWRNQINLRR